MKIRYSEVIGDLFYKIQLSESDQEACDIHFTAAAHHYHILKHCSTKSDMLYHLTRARGHISHLKSIVFERGDFSKASDPSGRGLECRSSWNPKSGSIIDPEMFDSMALDPLYAVGRPHPSDFFLTNVRVISGNKKTALKVGRTRNLA